MSEKPDVNWEDQDLLRALRNSNEKAFNILYRRYWQALYSTAYKRLKDEELCENAVQNVFIDLWKRRKQVDIDRISPYLHTAVKYQVFAMARDAQKMVSFIEPLEAMSESPFSADGAIIDQELKSLFEQWKHSLPAKRKKIFQLYFEQNLSSQEIATQLNISQKTVQNQVRTAAQNLRSQIAQFLSIFL